MVVWRIERSDVTLGVVRKQLGLTFLGETSDAMRVFLADIYIKGLSTEVWPMFVTIHASDLLMQYWHQWGDLSTKM